MYCLEIEYCTTENNIVFPQDWFDFYFIRHSSMLKYGRKIEQQLYDISLYCAKNEIITHQNTTYVEKTFISKNEEVIFYIKYQKMPIREYLEYYKETIIYELSSPGIIF